jgi:integrase
MRVTCPFLSLIVRYLKITNTLAEILNERKARSVGDFVFTQAGGEVTHYYEILTEACRVTGVPYGRARAGGLVTHDARHTAVTRMLQAGQDLATIGSITGQSDRTMILHYGHASQESRDRAMTVLDDFAGTQALGLRF